MDGKISFVLIEETGDKNPARIHHDDVHAPDIAGFLFDDADRLLNGPQRIALVKAPDVVENLFCTDPTFFPDLYAP